MDVQTTNYDGNHLLWDAQRLPQAAVEHFDHQWWAGQGALKGETRGRGAVYFLEGQPGDPWVLRHFRRGGEVRRITQDKYLWCGAERSRSFVEWRLLAELTALGLPVPAPVAARAVRSGLVYSADLITARIPATETLGERLQHGILPAASWQTLGRVVARFHAAGVDHHDLNANNILVAESTRFWLVDFDRGRMRKPGLWRSRNLARLRRSLDKLSRAHLVFNFGEADWAALQGGYFSRTSAG